MGNVRRHAERELALLGGSEDRMQQKMNEHILRMVDLFAEENHSGMSANYAVNILEKLLRFEPLTPLTGEDDEWDDVGDNILQNRRCSHVFKDKHTGAAYDINGRVFREPDGICYTSSGSRVYVEFPYSPKTEYVDVAKTP